jgi:hypothetical protein
VDDMRTILCSPQRGKESNQINTPSPFLRESFPFLRDIMFDKSNRYIYFLLDFVAVGFIRLFQIFQYSDTSACPEYIKGSAVEGLCLSLSLFKGEG